jgi:methionyl-tRNA formyltransferase
MKKMSETIVFFGSGPVAAKSLELLAKDFEIEAVITKPKPAHHKASFPVIEVANELGLKTLTTKDKLELATLFESSPVKSRLGIVIDYGIIISQAIIDYFPLGIVNSHFSLLPQWRGADPITFSILSGQQHTGVSLMLIVEALDEGPLLTQRECPMGPETTTPELTDRLIDISNDLLGSTLPLYISGEVNLVAQTESKVASSNQPSYSRKLTKQDGILDFSKPAVQLEREVRAYIEWPRSRTTIGNTNIIITKSHVVRGEGRPGDLWHEPKSLGIYTKEDILVIDYLIPDGKKEMPAEAFLAGYKIQ